MSTMEEQEMKQWHMKEDGKGLNSDKLQPNKMKTKKELEAANITVDVGLN